MDAQTKAPSKKRGEAAQSQGRHQFDEAQILAPTPPMGWNAWNAFRTNVDEAKIMSMVDALIANGLTEKGYEYVNIDDGWALRRKPDGRLEIRTSTYPSAELPNGDTSFKAWVDRLHGLGLKAGIYTDIGRNTCAQIWDAGRPNLPEGSVAEREVGAYGFEDQDMELFFAEWGFDFIKIDACGVADYLATSELVVNGVYRSFPQLIVRNEPEASDREQVESAYQKVTDFAKSASHRKRPVISICAWGEVDVADWGNKYGQLWRTSEDIGNKWAHVLRNFDSAAPRALFAGPGRWNDPDLMEIGNGDFGADNLIAAQTHFSLWCIIAAPLFLSLDLTKMSQGILDIISNEEAIAVNQDPAGNQGVIFEHTPTAQIIVKQLSDGSKAITMTNRGGNPETLSIALSDLNFDCTSPLKVRDIWAKVDIVALDGIVTKRLASRETLMLRVTGKVLHPNIKRLYEMPARVRVLNTGYRQPRRSLKSPWVPARIGFYPNGERVISGGRHDMHSLATSEQAHLQIALNSEFKRFRALPDQVGAVVIMGDGKALYRGNDERVEPIDIQIDDVQILEIIMHESSASAQVPHTRVLFDVAFEK